MKNLLIIIFAIFIANVALQAQVTPPPSTKPDVELTKAEADLRISQYLTTVQALEQRLKDLQNRQSELKAKLDDVNKQLADCQDEIKKLLGATDEDIAAFRQKLGVIENKVREMQRLPESQLLERQDEVRKLEADLNELRKNKIALIPEFYNKIIALAKDIKGLYRERKITTYTVGTWAENRDCLWNIAGKIEIYADPFMWPRIWQGNTDQIRNPDIIFPGQVLKIPAKGPKTSEEIKAERTYWRMKKEQQAADQSVQPGAN